jgi:1-acyl-sn-glycerol-3-phosphate acyltransferase|tara:strand:- start:1500 stop:2129 length:630 start_codon:yes stop_codon:yes gene_type:complete
MLNLNKICNFIQLKILNAFAEFHIEGVNNIPINGPLIFVANHQAYVDPSLISVISPRKVNFVAKSEVFKFVPVAALLKSYGAHPIKRNRLDLNFFRWAIKILNNGEALCLFPEGTRSNGILKKGLPGIVHLAVRSGVNIIPVGIEGTNKNRGISGVLFPRGKIIVKVGKAFKFEKSNKSLSRDTTDAILAKIMNNIAELIPSGMRGIYK